MISDFDGTYLEQMSIHTYINPEVLCLSVCQLYS